MKENVATSEEKSRVHVLLVIMGIDVSKQVVYLLLFYLDRVVNLINSILYLMILYLLSQRSIRGLNLYYVSVR